MQIGYAIATVAVPPTQKSDNNRPSPTTANGKIQPNQSFIRELATSFDPKNMSHKESMALANDLMKAGEADLSSAFLPPPLLKANSNGCFTDMTGTPEGEAIMNKTFNMFESLSTRIDSNKNNRVPTKTLEDAYSFLEKIQIARKTQRINEYT